MTTIILAIETLYLHQTKKTKNSSPEKPKIVPIPNPALISLLAAISPSYAGFWLRLKASLIDSFIVFIILMKIRPVRGREKMKRGACYC